MEIIKTKLKNSYDNISLTYYIHILIIDLKIL